MPYNRLVQNARFCLHNIDIVKYARLRGGSNTPPYRGLRSQYRYGEISDLLLFHLIERKAKIAALILAGETARYTSTELIGPKKRILI